MSIIIEKKCEFCEDNFLIEKYKVNKGLGKFCSRKCSRRSKTGINVASYKHGGSIGGKKSSEYNVWQAMKSRCNNISDSQYRNYGGRGIKVCDRWLGIDGYTNFFKDLGKRPNAVDSNGKSLYSIDRIDVNGNYEPSNCRWATRVEQANNMRTNRKILHKGENRTVSEWSSIFGIDKNLIYERLNRGWDVEKAITAKPDNARNRQDNVWLELDGETMILADWSRKVGIPGKTISRRIKEFGWSVREALTTPIGQRRT